MTDPQTETFDVPLIAVTIAARADEVWRALRDPALILQWFGWDAETLPAEVDFIFIEHARGDDQTRVLRFEGMGDRFEVEARGQQSILRVVRPALTPDTDWDAGFEDMTQGWMAFVQQLKFAMEHHGLAPRRTIYLSGSPLEAGDPLAAAALGLDDLPLLGQRYVVEIDEDARLTGHVWHKTRHQLGVTVDDWGNGLLVIMDRPANDRWPNGGSQATLTTYGLSDEDFADLEADWRDWWDERFEKPARATSD